MGIGTLIPFGLDAESNQLVDVASVRRGNACGCICPSCKTPLLAKQGDEKEWHFAHRSKNVRDNTKKECDYSFAVSVRLMIKQLAVGGLRFSVPDYAASIDAYSEHSFVSRRFPYTITPASELVLDDVQVEAVFAGVDVDVIGFVNGIPFVIFVTYKGRCIPLALNPPDVEKCGIVELCVDSLPMYFGRVENGQYKEALRDFLENDTEGRRWIYHPREQRAKEHTEQEVQYWLSEQKTLARKKRNARRVFSRAPGSAIDSKKIILHKEMPDPVAMQYQCVLCQTDWLGVSRECPKCKTHLYTRNI